MAIKTYTEAQTRLFDGLPDNITLRATSAFTNTASEYDVEETYIERAIDKRKAEFRTGRSLARQALEAMGMPPGAIPTGSNRAPLWPRYVVGSISHCDSLCVAALATKESYRSLGVDVEPNVDLPDEVRSAIFSLDERTRQQAGYPSSPDVLTFSAKESVFKCIFPLIEFYFDFDEVSLLIDEKQQRFTATLSDRIKQQVGMASVSGQYKISEAFVFTIAYVANGHLDPH